MSKNNTNPDIFGHAISDFFHGKDTEDITVYSNDFDNDLIPVDYLFREFKEMPPLERAALERCNGKILDVGCGAGSHALHLQDTKNFTVTGIDISEKGIEICQKRGLKDARCEDFFQLKNETFDTILMLMNGSGIVGKLSNLEPFFKQLKTLLAPKGKVLIDSSDLSYLFEQDEDGGVWIDASQGYYGELHYQIGYKNEISEKFDWLFIDFETLRFAAESNGFACKLLQEGDHYDYLAELTIL